MFPRLLSSRVLLESGSYTVWPVRRRRLLVPSHPWRPSDCHRWRQLRGVYDNTWSAEQPLLQNLGRFKPRLAKSLQSPWCDTSLWTKGGQEREQIARYSA